MEFNIIVTNIGIGIISSIIATIIIAIYNNFFNKKQYKSDNFLEKQLQYKDPVIIFGFITIILLSLTLFGMRYNWTSFPYIFMAALLTGMATKILYEKQCPECKKITKKLENKETLREEKRPYKYREEKITLYSDGEIKERKPYGKTKTIMETFRLSKELYKCINSECNHKWSETIDENLDIENRPKPHIKKTNEKNPDSTY